MTYSSSKIFSYAREFHDLALVASEQSDDNYSSIMRNLNKKNDKEGMKKFQEEYKKLFDEALLSGEENPEECALGSTIKIVAAEDLKPYAIKKIAGAIEMGSPETAGKYLANIVKFLTSRISQEKRQKSIDNLKRKIYYINEFQVASKKSPSSASLGQSLTLIKTVLLEHSPDYIRQALNSIVRNL